uniref:WSC domain-containing protein n=1 Tax=Macrostomum lignano TaxID=282301 RepID=A0A1I8I0B7_9PLAT
MDGNKNQDYGKHSCTHTKAPGGFWQGSFTRPAHIKEVVIYNRLDCCSNLLNNFDIIVDGQVCARHRSSTFFSVKRFKCDKVGQNVIIRTNLKKYLTLCEVEVFGEYTKLAAKRSDMLPLSHCSQSSVGWSGVCSRAIDGNTNQNYWGHSCTHTKLESGWWMAKTQKLAHIKEIKIFNRLDCCFDRLTNFVVTVDGHVCGSYHSHSVFKVTTFRCNRVGRVVMIRSRKRTYLTLCEVQVFGSYTKRSTGNKLSFNTCFQTSTGWNGVCKRAMDGNKNQDYGKHSCTHTKAPGGFWQGSFTRPAHIKEVVIYNRLDCCSNLLNNFDIIVDGQVCARHRSSTFFSVKRFKCDKVGQNVIIRNNLKKWFTLCEVEVFGEYTKLALRDLSSVGWNGVCSRAIDGNTNQYYWGHSCTHTKLESGWWMAKTQKLAHIKEIKIFNRLDCCSNRLTNFVVTVDGHVCGSYNSRGVFKVKTFRCNKVGKVVMIRSRKRTYLTLCEVQVFGDYFKKRPKFKYLGCFYDSKEYPQFSIKAASSRKMTQRKCNRFCKSRGTTYFAVQSGSRCFCGENYIYGNGEAEDGDCNVPCSGDSGIKCGGKMRNAVFEVDKNVS